MKTKTKKKTTKRTSLISGVLASKTKTPTETALAITKDLRARGLAAIEKIKVKNPITNKTAVVTIRRDGTPESELIQVLADPKKNRDFKDHALSMYLWGRGAESASMMVDLMRYKGAHTKETRIFKSQIRFDLEAFIGSLITHLETQAVRTASILDIDLKDETMKFRKFLKAKGKNNKKEGKPLLYSDFRHDMEKTKAALVSLAIFSLEQAQVFDETRERFRLARIQEKGGGIYVDAAGTIHSIHDKNIDDIIKQDREETRKINTE